MNESLKMQLELTCNLIQKGVKPMSFFPIQKRYKKEVINMISPLTDLYFHFEKLSNDWLAVYVYKNNIVKYLIKKLPEEPKTASEHAYLGLLLGYDIDSICKYISENCKL